jgi:cation diffusion facilitator family transporter
MITALLQAVVVFFSGSVSLLADTVHNFGDAATAIPLWIAFRLARRSPTKRFTYGYGRMEDLAGAVIVLIILASAVVTGYKSIERLFNPRMVTHLWAIAVASVIGFAGNEVVARFRIRVGKEIGSAALVADGHHARVDGLTSLGVLFGVLGISLGYPWADPVVGLLITLAILRIVWSAGKSVFMRLLDGIEPGVVDEIVEAVNDIPGVQSVSEVRVRWLGHRLHGEINIALSPTLTVEQGHNVAVEVRHHLLHHVPYLSNATVHVDPSNAAGERHHDVTEHSHDGYPPHGHSGEE